jgi:hypothetical protein
VLNDIVINNEIEREKESIKKDYTLLLSKFAHDYAEPFEHMYEDFENYLECDSNEKTCEDFYNPDFLSKLRKT